ncbi:2-oxoglutarate and iron-dependent oxygenase domain-containing protein ICU11 (Protein INCURVATA 11) [Durusdinium trenchii]|uniref:2-oxoglutarate and iron-dependent oxygenase domain-containing protein ICU11 (Protein INCURVATA 11) n=1 Tax=Durusdinium trenchii TaxID=1381693 RepID=A0ABP0QZS0_9DINO
MSESNSGSPRVFPTEHERKNDEFRGQPTPVSVRFRALGAMTQPDELVQRTVVQVDFDGDPAEGIVPYLVELDSGGEVLAPKAQTPTSDDTAELVVAAGQQPAEPWHVTQARGSEQRELRRRGMEYAGQAKHPALFQPSQLHRWLLPSFLEATSAWRSSGQPEQLQIRRLPNVRLETEGIVSFDCFTQEFCKMLLEEVLNYQASGLPSRPPNSMSNYGLVLNEIGLKPVFSALLEEHLLGIATRLFGPIELQDAFTAGSQGFEHWGGDSLSAHHTFVVRYQPDEDRSLDMHVDECDVTFNFGLTNSDDFRGSDLAFCGMLGSEEHRKHLHTYKHRCGRCVVHLGKRRHGALAISSGRRMSLIMWCRFGAFLGRFWGREHGTPWDSMGPEKMHLQVHWSVGMQ